MPKILVVDDDKRVRESFQYVLSTSGYETITVPNTVHAEEILLTQSIHAVVLDLNLGEGESGLVLLKTLRKISDTIPVIIFSGSVSCEAEIELKKAKATEIIDKIHGVIPVLERIDALLTRRN